jgi:Ca2+-binding RTX toxin-like protein
MAIAVTGIQTWVNDETRGALRFGDAVVRSDGTIVFAYGGTDQTFNALMVVGTLNTVTGTLTNTSTTYYPQAAGASNIGSVTRVDLAAGPDGRVSGLIAFNEIAQTGDTNGALLVQRYDGTAPDGPAIAVNPATPTDATYTQSSLIFGANGSSVAFFSEISSPGAGSDGIRMARFAPNGTAIGDPFMVIVDRPAGGPLPFYEASPTSVNAVARAGGGYGLTWIETVGVPAPQYLSNRIMYQSVSAAGVAIGSPVEIDRDIGQPSQIVALTSGRMVVVWLDGTAGVNGVYKAQMISAAGTKLGADFEISSTLARVEDDMSVVATADGGFAVSWLSNYATYMGRMFDGTGVAKGVDFALLAGNFTIPIKAGFVASGDTLYAYLQGTNVQTGFGMTVQGQGYSTAASWGKQVTGTAGADTINGTGTEDFLSGGKGRDILRGQGGTDLIYGGQDVDRLEGGTGDDQLTGGIGKDRLTGGLGADSFVFQGFAEGGDTITDFNGAEGDRLVFSTAGFGGATTVLSGAVLNTAHQGLFFNTTTGVLTHDADGAGASSVLTIAKLTGVTSLAFDDMLFLA